MKASIDTAKIPPGLLGIVERKIAEVEELNSSGKAEEYKKKALNQPSIDGFLQAITQPGLNLVAEFKKASPSKGEIRPDAEPEEIARLYEDCGACAISILTDYYFDGKIEHLQRIREAVSLPLLRKDFIIDYAQIYESRVYGADAILLIAAILEPDQIKDYISIAESLGMDCLVESHDRAELKKAIAAEAKIFGINNRNWEDGSTDIRTTLKLLPYIPDEKVIVTESGISTHEDVGELSHPRINAMLVGEGLMSSELNPTLYDMKNKIYELMDR